MGDWVMAGAGLSDAFLDEANLRWAVLCKADLTRAVRSEAELTKADLSEANLTGATVSDEQLATAKSPEDTTLRDGTRHSGAPPRPSDQPSVLSATGGDAGDGAGPPAQEGHEIRWHILQVIAGVQESRLPPCRV